jgi:hypothetical protein
VDRAAAVRQAQFGSAAWALPETVVSDLPAAWFALASLRPQVLAELFAPVFPALALSPEAAWRARRGALAQPAVKPRPGEPVAQDAVVEVRQAQPDAAQALRPEGSAAQHAAVAAEVVPQVAGPRAAGAVLAGVGLLREEEEAPGGPVPELPSAVVWVAAWVFHQDQFLPWPAPQPSAWFARAMASFQIASPSERWWQAATNEVLS